MWDGDNRTAPPFGSLFPSLGSVGLAGLRKRMKKPQTLFHGHGVDKKVYFRAVKLLSYYGKGSFMNVYSGLCSNEFCGEVFYSLSASAKFCGRSCMRGQHGPRWQGGARAKVNGYVLKRLPDGSQALEHRLVMAGTLGRPLYETETVHHKNGVRDDNRPENLELWARPQPPGQRVEDLVRWVVGRYPKEVRAMLEAAGEAW